MNKKFLITLVIITLSFFSFLPPVFATNFFSIVVDIYKNDTALLKSFEIGDLEGLIFDEGQGDYAFTLLSNNKKLFETRMTIEFEIDATEILENGTLVPKKVFVDQQEVYARLPYFENVTNVEIYRLDNLIFTYEICKTDGVCESSKGENTVNCPQDCPITTTTTPPVKKPSSSIYIYIIIASLIIAVAIFFLHKIRVAA